MSPDRQPTNTPTATTSPASEANPLADPPGRFAVAGDWHANTDWACDAIRYAAYRGATVILHTGDFAYTFDRPYLAAVSATARDTGVAVLFVDGNHDDHNLLASLPITRDGLRPIAPHIWHIPRGHRWSWHGVQFLGLGGAHSVDRQLRLRRGYSWWAGETVTAADIVAATSPGDVDVMICHDCPAGVAIPGLDSARFPAADVLAADKHRVRIAAVVACVHPVALWHGHYHVRYTAELLTQSPTCRVEGLAADGMDLAGNVRIVDFVDLAEHVVCARRGEPTPHF